MQEIPTARQEAGDPDIRPEDSFFQSLSEHEERVLAILEKQDLSQRNLAQVIESLDFANDRLQTAMHRIGYLEGIVEGMQNRMEILPELEKLSVKFPLLELENSELKTLLIGREIQLAESEAELKVVGGVLDKVRDSLWCRFWAWMTSTSV